MENAQSTNEVAGEPVAQEKKARKMKKIKRETFVVEAIKSGDRDAMSIAVKLSEAGERGLISMKKVHKLPLTTHMWFLQVKWYFHQAKKKGLIDGDLIMPPRQKRERKKKEAVVAPVEAVGAGESSQPAEEAIGTL